MRACRKWCRMFTTINIWVALAFVVVPVAHDALQARAVVLQ